MLKIDKKQNITLTRGDTLTLTVQLYHEVSTSPSSDESIVVPYVPEEGDVIRFAVSKGYKGEPGYELQISKIIPNDTLTFTCTSMETSLENRTFNYDVEITHADGTVDTFIEGALSITGEAE